ncbi:MAG: DUF2207 domain-containing protein [Alphaproteobacteria bacterium]|nr:DUF2207 domain-containing protein [Alphaproteobacteria bacterium]
MTPMQAKVAYSAPAGISPALARLHHLGGYDNRTFAVAILQLVAEGHLRMAGRADGTIALSRTKSAPPKEGTARHLLRQLSREGGFIIGRENYSALLHIRRKHRQKLDRERASWAGNDGIFLMAGIAFTFLLLAFAVGVLVREPMNTSILSTLLPYWPIAAIGYGALILSRVRRKRKPSLKASPEAQIEGYRHFLEVAMVDRLNPRFMPSGANSQVEPEIVFAAAFGYENTWADPLITLVENLLPDAPNSLHVYSAIERGEATNKRDRGPRKEDEHVSWFL